MRVNAPSIVERCGCDHLLALAVSAGAAPTLAPADMSIYAMRISTRTDHLPGSVEERAIDHALGRAAVRTAVRRHAGTLREIYTPAGFALVQEGKDLTDVAAVVGVGGVLAHGGDARFVLEGALAERDDAFSVLPKDPALYLDKQYVLYGVGLLSAISPDAAIAIAREVLIPL